MSIDFATLQATLIAGELGALETERKAFVRKFWKRFFLAFGLMVAVPVIIYYLNPSAFLTAAVFAVLILVASIIFLVFSYKKFYKALKFRFKGEVIPTVVRFVDERLTYNPEAGLMNPYNESGIFTQRYDRFKAEDTISGTFDKTDFSFGEIHTEYKSVSTDSNGKRQEQWQTIFKGVFFVSDFHKNFQGETIVDFDFMERFLGRLGRKFQQWNPSRKGNLVKLENPEFEKHFAVYSTDELECRYILTPSMMERLLEMKKKMNCWISLSFRNNQVYIAVFNNKDLFEPSVFGSLLKEKDYQTIIAMLRLMTGVIDDLNLNTRIWTRE